MHIENLNIEILDTGHITNSYLIFDDTKEAILIDPADKSEIIENKINELNLKLKYIFLTHGHADHVLAIDKISDKYSVKIIASLNEKGMFDGTINNCSQVFGLTQKEYDLDKFIFLKDNDSIDVGNMKFRLIETPGHTAGSCCYYLKDENVLITGDTLFFNCFGRCDLETGNIDNMINSLIKLYRDYGKATIYPGHDEFGMKVEDTYERIRRYLKYTSKLDLNDLLN